MHKLNEECGVFAVIGNETTDVAATAYYGLFALQHRGQESCGIAVNDDGLFRVYKDVGLVNDVFDHDAMAELGMGNMALGHVRYGTASNKGRANAQPMVVNHIKGRMALAHNGTLVNYYELREELELTGAIFHSTSDTEVISYLITKERLSAPSIEEAVNRAMDRLEGAFSLVVMSPTKMIAARDERGFRPLCYGVCDDGRYVIASETCALDTVGAKFIRDVDPGEIVIFDGKEVRTIRDHCGKQKKSLCVFEYVYFARPDSAVDGMSVHEARKEAGRYLAKEHPVDADIVIGVPDSGLDAAIGYAEQSGIPYGIGFIKNKYIGRTFIAPGQSAREDLVKIKLNPVPATVKGKKVVMIDDSIVRGTTCARIVKLLREAGAAEVHVRISSPPFLNPCYYGTDIDSRDALIACRHTIPEIREIIGADTLGYLSLDAIGKIAGADRECEFCRACFTGEYPTRLPVPPKKDYGKRISEKDGKVAEHEITE